MVVFRDCGHQPRRVMRGMTTCDGKGDHRRECRLESIDRRALEEKINELNVGVEFQFFISTHSPFIIRGALNSPINKIFHIQENSQLEPIDFNSLKVNNGREFDDILNDLGFEMKDLFYCNKLIYVEGPVDILYINYLPCKNQIITF